MFFSRSGTTSRTKLKNGSKRRRAAPYGLFAARYRSTEHYGLHFRIFTKTSFAIWRILLALFVIRRTKQTIEVVTMSEARRRRWSGSCAWHRTCAHVGIHIGNDFEFIEIEIGKHHGTEGICGNAEIKLRGFSASIFADFEPTDFQIFDAELRALYEHLEGRSGRSPSR